MVDTLVGVDSFRLFSPVCGHACWCTALVVAVMLMIEKPRTCAGERVKTHDVFCVSEKGFRVGDVVRFRGRRKEEMWIVTATSTKGSRYTARVRNAIYQKECRRQMAVQEGWESARKRAAGLA